MDEDLTSSIPLSHYLFIVIHYHVNDTHTVLKLTIKDQKGDITPIHRNSHLFSRIVIIFLSLISL